MTESGQKTCGRIQATRQWLTRAEKHFSQDASVRGEMDLLLAEAELRSTREKLQAGKSAFIWFQHGLALGIATVIVAFGLGGAYWFWRDAPAPSVMQPTAVTVPVMAPATPSAAISTAPAAVREDPPRQAVISANPKQEVNTIETPAPQDTAVSPVSPDEMKRLVRSAGQSLRGQIRH